MPFVAVRTMVKRSRGMTSTHLQIMRVFSASLAALTLAISGVALAPNALASIEINMRGKGSITYINDGNPVSRTRSFTNGIMYESKPHSNYANPLNNAAPNSGESWTNENAFVNKAAKDRMKYPGVWSHTGQNAPLGTLEPDGVNELNQQKLQHHAEGRARTAAENARNKERRAKQSQPAPQPQRSASKPQTEYEAMMERVNSGAPTPTPSRSTYTPAPRSTSKPSRTASSSSSRCPAGQQYAKVKMGGLFNRRTIFEGCGTANEIAYWRNQAHQDSQSRWNNFGRALQEAGDDYNRQVQQDIRDQQNRQRNCTTNFIGSTAYTNCY